MPKMCSTRTPSRISQPSKPSGVDKERYLATTSGPFGMTYEYQNNRAFLSVPNKYTTRFPLDEKTGDRRSCIVVAASRRGAYAKACSILTEWWK